MPPGFKEVLHRDIDKVFLNLVEFAEELEVGGTTIKVVRGGVSEFELPPGEEMPLMQPALPMRTVTLHARTEDLDSEITMGAVCSFDGEECTVLSRRDSLGGLTKLVLGRHGY